MKWCSAVLVLFTGLRFFKNNGEALPLLSNCRYLSGFFIYKSLINNNKIIGTLIAMLYVKQLTGFSNGRYQLSKCIRNTLRCPTAASNTLVGISQQPCSLRYPWI